MNPKLNQLTKVADFDKAYLLAQQAYEEGFRGATFSDLYLWLKTKLDLLGLSNTAGLPEEFPEDGDTLQPYQPLIWTILGPGTYPQAQGAEIVVGSEEFVFAQSSDGESFDRVLRIDMPTVDVIDSFDSESTTYASSANTVKILNIDKVSGTYSKNRNKFDKNAITQGLYIDNDGSLIPNVNYFYSEKIKEFSPGESIKTNTNLHGGNVVEYNSSDDVIVKNSFNETNITLNMFTSYIRITGELNILETLIVQSASQSMIENLYQSGVKRVLKEQISDYYKNGNCIVVSKDGYYNTIFKAREWILYYGGGEKYTILVMPGIYEEVVNISGLNISLVGVDKLNCIILDKSGDYYNAPINMGGGNLVKNLTIIASHENMPIGYLDEHEPSYGIHHDAEGEGKSYIEDCDIISYQSAAIGIGTQNNQQLTVKNCTLRTDTSGLPINKRERAALLAHNYPLAGASRQRLIVDNCRISSNSQFVFIAGDPNNEPTGGKDDRDSKWSFYNNIFWSDMIGKDPSIFYLIGATDVPEGDIGYIKITGDSFGNNIDVLNK